MIATAQIAVQTEYQQRFYASVVDAGGVRYVAGKLSGGRIVLSAQIAYGAKLGIARAGRHPLRKNANHAWILLRAAVSTHNVIVQHSFNVPFLGLCHLGKMMAAIQALLFPGNGKKNN